MPVEVSVAGSFEGDPPQPIGGKGGLRATQQAHTYIIHSFIHFIRQQPHLTAFYTFLSPFCTYDVWQ